MRSAFLTRHAEARLNERCTLPEQKLKGLLDKGATVPVATQKAGRHAKRLLYSTHDESWFIVVQDADDGGILTVMPLAFLKYRVTVTAAQKRGARKRARTFESAPPPPQAAAAPQSAPRVGGWKLHVHYTVAGQPRIKNLPRTLPELGDPSDRCTPGPIHDWLRQHFLEAAIPLRAVHSICVERKGEIQSADWLLEHLPMTQEEIEQWR